MNKYTIDKCMFCKNIKPLKNGICVDCNKDGLFNNDNNTFMSYLNKTFFGSNNWGN